MMVGRMALCICIIALLAASAAWFFGPRTEVDTEIGFDPASIGPDPDRYLAEVEAQIPGIKPGQQKQIIWAKPEARAKTPIAIVYIHGFSASLGEVRPLPDVLAGSLGANLFYTRLEGHGVGNDAMGLATVHGWINDFAEAMAIGSAIGERVVVISTSSGGSLATWALSQPAFRDKAAAVIFISPNYQVQATGSFLLTMPFAKQMAHLLIGERRSFIPYNELQRALWTYEYPVEALLPMAETVKLAVNAPVETIRTPAYFLISPDDKVIVPHAVRDVAARWGGPHKLTEIQGVDDPYSHVLAGDAMSPSTTEMVATAMTEWLRQVLRIN